MWFPHIVLLIHLINYRRAIRLYHHSAILSHYLARLASFLLVFSWLIYLALYYIDASCHPVLVIMAHLDTLITLFITAILLLRIYHAYDTASGWFFGLGCVVLCVEVYASQLVARHLTTLDQDVCLPSWPRDIIRVVFWIRCSTGMGLALLLLIALWKRVDVSSTVWCLVILYVNVVGDVVVRVPSVVEWYGVVYSVKQVVVTTCLSGLLWYIYNKRQA
jgi:hypothetical protein